jgi:hypothetical protein
LLRTLAVLALLLSALTACALIEEPVYRPPASIDNSRH